MPNITFTYTGKLPYHASHKLDGKWVDICLGNGDTIDLTETAQADPAIKNLIKTGVLSIEAAKPAKATKPKVVKPAKPAPADNDTNNITNPTTLQ